jgi:6-phosphogluconolactonase
VIAEDAGRKVRIFGDRAAMDRAAAELVSNLAAAAIGARQRFSAALSGGATPEGLFTLLASETYRGRIAWEGTHIFWADERCVPPDHEDSNYGSAAALLLRKVPLPREHVHRIYGEEGPSAAANRYERELISFFGAAPFTFDLVILGMGADGHTASLFPGASELDESSRLAVPVPVPGPRARHSRVTLTLPAINRARAVLFLVAGDAKAKAVGEVLQGKREQVLPAGLVRSRTGGLFWYLDGSAAKLLGVQ